MFGICQILVFMTTLPEAGYRGEGGEGGHLRELRHQPGDRVLDQVSAQLYPLEPGLGRGH